MRRAASLLLVTALSLAIAQKPPGLSADAQTAIGRIEADSLQGNLSFLASDLLEYQPIKLDRINAGLEVRYL